VKGLAVPLVVQKFGGSSVATAERVKAAARRAIRAKQAGYRVVVVVSARGDTTDDLIELAREINETPPAREMDMLLATGEQISIALMAMAIHSLGEEAISLTGVQIGIRTDSVHTKARIREISTARIWQALDEGKIVIVAGFQGVNEKYDITTLGRGGSDTTAVALAAALKHDPTVPADKRAVVECEIYTDVDGVYTTDPRIVPEARKLDSISYDEMLEMASMGAGVMHSRSIEFARKFDVPLMVRSSFSDAVGTWIVPEADWMMGIVVSGAALAKDETRVSLENIPDRPGISYRIISAIAEKNIAVDMIAQSVGSNGTATIGFTVLNNDLNLTLAILRPVIDELGGRVGAVEDVAKVSVVGAGMRHNSGVAERMFGALAAENVNIRMVTTGDIKISCLVDRADGGRALRAVHQAFDLEKPRPGAGMSTANPSSTPTVAPASTTELLSATSRLTAMEDILISGVALDTSYGRVTVFDVPDRVGNCARVFQAVAASGISVDMIVQNMTGSDKAELSFTIPRRDLERGLIRTQDLFRELAPTARVAGDADIAVLHVWGVGMRTHTGVARTMFGALAARDINIAMINTSEVCVSVAVELSRGEEALRCLRDAFHLT